MAPMSDEERRILSYLQTSTTPASSARSPPPSPDPPDEPPGHPRDGARPHPRLYREAGITTLRVEPEGATLDERLATYGEHASGLGKFTRTLFARDLRRTLESAGTRDAMLLSGARPD